jgi:hypothetical protein
MATPPVSAPAAAPETRETAADKPAPSPVAGDKAQPEAPSPGDESKNDQQS